MLINDDTGWWIDEISSYHFLYICVSFLNCCKKKFLKASKDSRNPYLWTQHSDLPGERACSGIEKENERMVVIKILSGSVAKLYIKNSSDPRHKIIREKNTLSLIFL